MGIFNQHSNNNQPQQQSFLRGLRGSPGVGFSITSDGNYDMNNKKLKNVGEGVESSDAVTKHQLEVSMNTRANKTSLTIYVKKNSPEVAADLDMKGFEVKNMKLTPAGDLSATSKKYVDRKLGTKANKNDLNDYLKLDGTSQMQGGLNMNNKRITRLPDPKLADEPVTKKFLTLTNTLFYNIFLDLEGNSKMRGNLQMNDKRITGLTNSPNADDEATNKKYVDDNISKANIKPSHTPKNVFQYLMDDVNEWSTEYDVKVENFSNLAECPHSWDKKVLNITPVKNGSSGDLYYSKTLIKFKKTSSSAPIFVYFTVHFDDNGGGMNTYPKDFKNQVYVVAYGIVEETDHVDSEVYDAHEAFEIDNNRMKMLVPLDMNGKQLININYDLRFGDIFKIFKCRVNPLAQQGLSLLFKKSDDQILSYSIPLVVHSLMLYNHQKLNNNSYVSFNPNGSPDLRRQINLVDIPSIKGRNISCAELLMMCVFTSGLRNVSFINIGNSQFNADIVLTFM